MEIHLVQSDHAGTICFLRVLIVSNISTYVLGKQVNNGSFPVFSNFLINNQRDRFFSHISKFLIIHDATEIPLPINRSGFILGM